MNRAAIVGCILGTAVGDAMGLPYEGVSADRAPRLLGSPDRHRFFFGRGMVSDDTEHTCMVAQSLIEANGDVGVFAKQFASRLRWWLLALPAGVGKATARAGVKLWLKKLSFRASVDDAGVFSAGNGPAMRAAILGAAIDDRSRLLAFVRSSSRLTHTDPKAEYGAIAIAFAARHARQNETIDASHWLGDVTDACGADASELIDLLRQAVRSVESQESTESFAQSLGLQRGVTGYTYHTVPVAIHAWLTQPFDFRAAVSSTIQCGGDADTTAAIVGGIVGARVGKAGIPADWLNTIVEYPRSVAWMQQLGETLASALDGDHSTVAPTANLIAVLMRNLLFLLIVLFHGFRRLAPPY